MYLLLSGEGRGDMGRCEPASETCDADRFQPGPMALMVDQIVEATLGYDFSHIDLKCASFVSEAGLKKSDLPALRMHLRGKKIAVKPCIFIKMRWLWP